MQVKRNSKELSFFDLYDRFMNDNRKGRRLQPNGKRVSAGTISNYFHTRKLLLLFAEEKQFFLRIRSTRRLGQRQIDQERKYWKNFYKLFSSWLYDSCGHYDNYVGQNMKILRVFFNYLNRDLALEVGQFHKQFYVVKDNVPIFPLMPEELNFLIYDTAFSQSLSRRMMEVKDFFVFGCTVALRVSDLFRLKKRNLRIVNGQQYLAVRSIKTNTDTLIRLPDYALEIVKRYSKLKEKLLPHFNNSNLNKYIKVLLRLAGFTNPVMKTRSRRGKLIELKRIKNNGMPEVYRFCDVACTHSMRRTAITTMLALGVPEQIVRRISGHSPSGKEFYRYVLWAQTYQDTETTKMFEKLRERNLHDV